MHAPHNPGILAKALLDSFRGGSGGVASLVLLEHLVARQDVNLQMPWGVKRHGKQPFEAPLGHALMWGASPTHYAPHFYQGDTAARLLALDPGIFSSRTPDGQWWFWSLLEKWHNEDDPIRSGFDSREPGKADAWACHIITSLPGAALEGPDAKDRWSLLLHLGLGHAAGAFARRNPAMWSARDNKGALLLKKAKESKVWVELLDSGIDPFAPLPGDKTAGKNAKALWRELVPQSSRTAPPAGSFREAVEGWLAHQVQQGHPETEAILAHKLKWMAAWLTAPPANPTSPTSPTWATRAWNDVMRVLEQQPIRWLSQREPHVGWAQPFLSRVPGQPKRWAKTLQEKQDWLSEAGPACAIAITLFDFPFLDKVPESVLHRFAQSPHRDQDRQALVEMATRKVWGNRSPSPGEMGSFLDAWMMGADLPAAPPSPAKKQPGRL